MSLSLEDEILLLRAQVDYLLERIAERPDLTEKPVNWTALNRAEAQEQWQLLIHWTTWLRDLYQLHETVPACWYAHPAMVEELTALRTAWTGTFLSPTATPVDALLWQEALDRTRYRLQAWDRNGCSDGSHRPDLPVRDDTDHDLLQQTIDRDLAQRPEEGQQT